MSKHYQSIENAIEYDELIGGGEIPILNANVTIKGGDAIKRGTLMSISSDNTIAKTAKGGVADYILQEDIEATSETTVIGTVYISGRFNREKIIVANGDSVESHEQELRMRNIYLTSLK
ncbi:MAG: hypothetical protein IJ728_03195 [Selenomonadaceae bacterium]|nr:hypothetical protein [Selenomonadaceae bacterium]